MVWNVAGNSIVDFNAPAGPAGGRAGRPRSRMWDVVAVVVSTALFVWAARRTFGNIDQDAWIYFTYFKRFFERPFSFQPHHVSFGATSPLHVLVFAPIFRGFGSTWLAAAKAANFALVFASVCLVHRAAKADLVLLPVVVATCIWFEPLFQNTATLFETGVSCLCISSLIFFLTGNMVRPAIVTAGLLHLARPELLLVTVAVFVWLARRESKRRLGVFMVAAALIPLTAYYGYMWLSGAGWLPSSVVGRAIIAREYDVSWLDTLLRIAADRALRPYAIVAGLTLVASVIAPRQVWPAWLVIVPVVGVYVIQPPVPVYVPRYLISLVPALLYGTAVLAQAAYSRAVGLASDHLPGATTFLILSGGICVAAIAWTQHVLPSGPRFDAYSYDTILQRDLADAVTGAIHDGDKALMYEIQGQYYFPGFGVSADGIVGSEARPFLLKMETFDDFVDRVSLKFVVTFNGFNYRPIFRGTPLVDLYLHDLSSDVGDEVCLGRHCYEKIATNPYFSRWYEERPTSNLNVGSSLRFYSGDGQPNLRGQLIQWNSVYRIRPR